jgi:methylase of polypeptide subunit release factors
VLCSAPPYLDKKEHTQAIKKKKKGEPQKLLFEE